MILLQMIYLENGANNPVFNSLHYGYFAMQSMIDARFDASINNVDPLIEHKILKPDSSATINTSHNSNDSTKTHGNYERRTS